MKFVHTADNHLDMPTSNLPPLKAKERKRLRRLSFSKIIDYTISDNADMLIISGDLFHTPTPSSSTIAFCKREFERLGSIPVFIALGNHDYGVDFSDFPPNTHVFPKNIKRFSYGDTVLTGISFSSETADFCDIIPPCTDKTKTNILVMHADAFSHSEYNHISLEKLLSFGYDYIALGHIHTFYQHDTICYPGCHDGNGFDEADTKHFISGEISPQGLKIERISSSTAEYKHLTFDISHLASSREIVDELKGLLVNQNIYSIFLTGSTKDGFSPNLDYICQGLSDFAFHITVSDNTKTPIDISHGKLYEKVTEYLSENCPDSALSDLAMQYAIRALRGDDILL